MPHACLTASCVAVRTHVLLHQQLGLPTVADAVILSLFRQFSVKSLKRGYRPSGQHVSGILHS